MSVFLIAQENEDQEVGLYALTSYILLLPPHYFIVPQVWLTWQKSMWFLDHS